MSDLGLTGIIGSGFGLYGYLPAAIELDKKVCLLERAKDKLLSRNDVRHLYSKIRWQKDIDSLLNSISTLIIAVPPVEQQELLYKVVKHLNIANLIIEKPIAISPFASHEALKLLSDHNINFRISYSFLYSKWYKKLKTHFNYNNKNCLSVNLKWHFKAHHYKHSLENWKRFHSDGGGVIRFFGIHLIAIAADLGLDTVVKSASKAFFIDDLYQWNFLLSHNTNQFVAEINTASEDEIFELSLSVSGVEVQKYRNKSPFDSVESSNITDNRIPTLVKMLEDLGETNCLDKYIKFYQETITLWDLLEKQLEVQYDET